MWVFIVVFCLLRGVSIGPRFHMRASLVELIAEIYLPWWNFASFSIYKCGVLYQSNIHLDNWIIGMFRFARNLENFTLSAHLLKNIPPMGRRGLPQLPAATALATPTTDRRMLDCQNARVQALIEAMITKI